MRDNYALAAKNKSREERGASESPGRQMGTRKIAACGPRGGDVGQEERALSPTEDAR